MPISLDEFEAAYAARSRVSVAWLHERGRRAEPCHCGEEGCEGWQMAHERWFRWPSPKGSQVRLSDLAHPWPPNTSI